MATENHTSRPESVDDLRPIAATLENVLAGTVSRVHRTFESRDFTRLPVEDLAELVNAASLLEVKIGNASHDLELEAISERADKADAERRAECIAMQAQRVIEARDRVRSAWKAAAPDEFPAEPLSVLFAEIKALHGWLEPAEPTDDQPADDSLSIRQTFDALKAVESQLEDVLDNFPLPPDMTEPAHEQ